MPNRPDPPALDSDPVSCFEDALKELESIVQGLERGEQRLEEALQRFERGVELARQCRAALDAAELRVRTLVESRDSPGEAS